MYHVKINTMKKIILYFILGSFFVLNAQNASKDTLPYYEIPDYPKHYTAGSVSARMIDGLGFRFYWATEGLSSKDLAYKPSEKGRTSKQTLDHIFGLSNFIYNAASNQINDRTIVVKDTMSFEEKRKAILLNFKQAADVLRTAEDLGNLKILIKNQQGLVEFPFWNTINGPIADALWHTGQLVLLRRASGNPLNPKVSVFAGKLRE